MKIAILSDSHDNLSAIESSLKIIKQRNITLILHLGDFISPFTIEKMKENFNGKMIAVFGNNDGEKIGLYKLFKKFKWEIHDPPLLKIIDGKKFLLFHSLPDFEKIGFALNYVLFGHTHSSVWKNGSVLYINPGELCGYLTGEKTFFILDTDKDRTEKIVIP